MDDSSSPSQMRTHSRKFWKPPQKKKKLLTANVACLASHSFFIAKSSQCFSCEICERRNRVKIIDTILSVFCFVLNLTIQTTPFILEVICSPWTVQWEAHRSSMHSHTQEAPGINLCWLSQHIVTASAYVTDTGVIKYKHAAPSTESPNTPFLNEWGRGSPWLRLHTFKELVQWAHTHTHTRTCAHTHTRAHTHTQVGRQAGREARSSRKRNGQPLETLSGSDH